MKLLVQYNNNKFVNNIMESTIENTSINITDVDGILYKLYYQNQYTHIIFIESAVTNEILQFISEFFQNIKIFIYHDKKPNMDFINTYGSSVRHILQNSHDLKHPSCTIAPKLLNDQIFINSNLNKDDTIACFLDDISSEDIVNKIQPLLYPKRQERIKLFNNPEIKHPQNVGLVSEKDKAYILQKSKYYLGINDSYIPEALACGCIILDSSLDTLSIDENFLASYTSYKTFLQELINE